MHAQPDTFITHRKATCATPSRLPAWLRLAASDIRTALSWRWLVYLAACLMRLQWRVGTTSMMVPSKTGGVDHSYAAASLGRPAPMAFRGGRHRNDSCNDGPNAMPVHMDTRGIYTNRIARMVRARLRSFGVDWCTAPMHTFARARVRGATA